MTTQPYTPAARPVAVDLDAARTVATRMEYDASVTDPWGARESLENGSDTIRALAADLAHTRDERDAALAALPDADDLDSIAQALPAGPEQLYQWAIADRIRALDAAPVPAADGAGATS